MKKLLVLFVLILLGTYSWYRLALRPVNASDDVRRSVSITSGMSVQSIANQLAEGSLIRSPTAFTAYTRLHGLQSRLQAGDFLLTASMDVPQIIEILSGGLSQELIITIPEGFTVKDIDALLTGKKLIKAGEFTACAQTCELKGFGFLPTGTAMPAGRSSPKASEGWAKRGGKVEGYLFPDTYFVLREGFTAQSFLERLLQIFQRRVVEGLAADLKNAKKSLHEVVTMASLIEEETKTEAERPVVAGILWKRFTRKVGLGVDATVRYILEKPTSAITVADLEIDSPYNTRKYRGLPPGPIANPGLSSIKAALHPQESAYWFYLHDKQGVIHYAVTNDEHNANKRKYLSP